MALWPDTLPIPLVEGYSVNDTPLVQKTQMEQGPARRRMVSADTKYTGIASMVVDVTQADTLRDFMPTISYGADYIDDLPLDLGLGVSEVAARIDTVTWQVLVPQQVYKVQFNFETRETS